MNSKCTYSRWRFADIYHLLVGLPKHFDIVRYTEKLSAPALHISRLLKIAQNRKFKEIFKLPTNVLEVKTRHTPVKPLNPPSHRDIRLFLAHCYGSPGSEDEDIVAEVIDNKSANVLRAIESCSTLDIDPPHCECTLVCHHLSQQSTPFPYIAVSKPSCLTCVLYIAACAKYRRQGGGAIEFQTRGYNADATRLVALPNSTESSTSDLDDFVKREIMDAVQKILKVILRTSVKEKMRRLSQSTAGSDDSSPDPLVNSKFFLPRSILETI